MSDPEWHKCSAFGLPRCGLRICKSRETQPVVTAPVSRSTRTHVQAPSCTDTRSFGSTEIGASMLRVAPAASVATRRKVKVVEPRVLPRLGPVPERVQKPPTTAPTEAKALVAAVMRVHVTATQSGVALALALAAAAVAGSSRLKERASPNGRSASSNMSVTEKVEANRCPSRTATAATLAPLFNVGASAWVNNRMKGRVVTNVRL